MSVLTNPLPMKTKMAMSWFWSMGEAEQKLKDRDELWEHGRLHNWNDRAGRQKEEVQKLFRETAKGLRNGTGKE